MLTKNRLANGVLRGDELASRQSLGVSGSPYEINENPIFLQTGQHIGLCLPGHERQR